MYGAKLFEDLKNINDDYEGTPLTIHNLANIIQEYNSECSRNDAEKAAEIFYRWYSNEDEEFCPDVRDMLDMLDAADDIAERDFCAKALGQPDMYGDVEESDYLYEGYNAASIQKFIDSYGFSEYDVYENTPTELAIDFDGESKEDIIPLVNRLKSIIPDVDVEDHYIRISLEEPNYTDDDYDAWQMGKRNFGPANYPDDLPFESFRSADNFTTEPRHIKKAFGKWSIPDDDGDGDIDGDDFNAFMKAHYSEAGLDSSNWTPDMWATARSFYNEALKESLNESELIEKFDIKQAIKAIKDNASKAKDFVNNNPKLNKLLDKAEAMLHSSSNIKDADRIAYMISMIRDWLNGSYKDIPVNVIIGLTSALLYWILPDLIPGPADDMGVLAIALKSFGKDIDNYIAWKNNQGKANKKTESLEEERKPKYWNTSFADKVIKAFDSGELKLSNIAEWEKSYNGGKAPNPSLGTKEILTYYINNKKKKTESLEEAVVDDATGKEILNYVKKYLPQNKPVGLRYNPANVPAIRDFLHKNGYKTDYDDRNNVIHVKK